MKRGITFWKRRLPFIFILVLLAAVGWHHFAGILVSLPATGGELFHGFTPLAAPFFLQTDDRWKNDRMGGSGEILEQEGCAVCSLAMALNHFGSNETPATINRALIAHGGYTSGGAIIWKSVSSLTDGKLMAEVVVKPTHASVDSALKAGNPVMAKILIDGGPHWMLITSKDGLKYLVHDPMGDGRNLEPAEKYGWDFSGIRIIRPVR